MAVTEGGVVLKHVKRDGKLPGRGDVRGNLSGFQCSNKDAYCTAP